MSETLAYAFAVALMVGGAIGVLVAKEALRLALSFGVFLLGVAACFLYFGLGFLATAQVFIYVGGVLVLVLFALMIVGREAGDRMVVRTRLDIGSATTALAVTVLMTMVLWPEFDGLVPAAGVADAGSPAGALLGEYLLAFEIAGALLLVAVLAVIAIVSREDSR